MPGRAPRRPRNWAGSRRILRASSSAWQPWWAEVSPSAAGGKVVEPEALAQNPRLMPSNAVGSVESPKKRPCDCGKHLIIRKNSGALFS